MTTLLEEFVSLWDVVKLPMTQKELGHIHGKIYRATPEEEVGEVFQVLLDCSVIEPYVNYSGEQTYVKSEWEFTVPKVHKEVFEALLRVEDYE